MLPMIANNLLQSISLLAHTATALADKAIASFIVNEDNITAALYKNPILVTALNPVIGYAKAAEIAKKAYVQKRSVVDVAEELSGLSREELIVLLDPNKLTYGGI
jgi:fumarate hydratase class II